MNRINAQTDLKTITIEIPLSSLVRSQGLREGLPIKIKDNEEMMKWVTCNILEFGNEEETKFHRLIDDLFVEAVENAEDWLSVEWDKF